MINFEMVEVAEVPGAMAAVDRPNSILAIVSGYGKVFAASTQCQQGVHFYNLDTNQK